MKLSEYLERMKISCKTVCHIDKQKIFPVLLKRILPAIILLGLLTALFIDVSNRLNTHRIKENIHPDIHNAIISSTCPEQLDYVEAHIEDMHSRINGLIGWGGLYQFESPNSEAWEMFDELLTETSSTIEKLITLIDIESIRVDLQTFHLILNHAYTKRDTAALRYAHRIIHDLNYWVFNRGLRKATSDYWRATITLEGENTSISRWVNRNILNER